MTRTIAIVDRGRGPQIEGHRLTVLDVFYYLHRGHDFDFIQRALPSLSREEFDAVVAYVARHRDELVEQDRQADEFIRRGIEEQEARGLRAGVDESVPVEERIARLRTRLRGHSAGANGDRATG